MNILKNKIINEIYNADHGISLEKFIDICLFSQEGYYKKTQPLGKNGDFVTAPEISQLFGEILGLYIFNIWQKNLKTNFNLIELGPGTGILISDILRITKSLGQFHSFLHVNLIEINKHLKKLQKTNIEKINFDLNKIKWNNSFKNINFQPSIIFANEFFDCFPIRQFLKINGLWNEKNIKYNNKEEKLFFSNYIINDVALITKLNRYTAKHNFDDKQIIEISFEREKYFDKICKFIKKNSGIIIVFDYGYNTLTNYSTLQSINNHNNTHIFDNPGQQDITSLVNFSNFKKICIKNKLNYIKIFSQKDFLIKNGIIEREKKILLNSNTNQKKDIRSGLQKLISNKKMGSIFKCLVASNHHIYE